MLPRFFDALDVALSALIQTPGTPPAVGVWSTELGSLCKQLIATGDQSAKELADIPADDLPAQQPHLQLHLHGMDIAKSFLVLWRDSTLELSKSHFYGKDKLTGEAQIRWVAATQAHLVDSAAQLKQYCLQPLSELTEPKKSERQLLKAWQRQDLPWPAYREQLETIAEQSEQLAKQHRTLVETDERIGGLAQLVDHTIRECLDDAGELETIAEQAIELLENYWPEQANKLPSLLENIESKVKHLDYNARFAPKLDRQLKTITEGAPFAIDVAGQHLMVRDINFRQHLSAWMDTRILPPMYEISELTTQLRGNLKMAIINVRNRIILLNAERVNNQDNPVPLSEILPPLRQFDRQLSRQRRELSKLQDQVTERMQQEVQISAIFEPAPSFLDTPLPSTLSRLRVNQEAWLNTLPNWLVDQRERFYNWINDVRQEDALSISEKIVRYIERQQPDPNNQSYTNIFLTHGYIGDSFWVGREAELKRVSNIVRQWKQGFRGAVLLTGDRFCGKTLLGDLISNEHFPQQTLRLTPNSTITYQGRPFTTTYDLGAALQFVSKYLNDDRPLVWIDDLERWHDPKQTISQNATALKQHIDRYANGIFYVVSLCHPLHSLLERSHALSNHFQATIPLDTMSQDEIRQAILIRHGATHKDLVNTNGEKVDASDFGQLIKKIYYSAEANIGEALNHWAYSTTASNIDEVQQRNDPFYALPDFLTPDHAVLLRTILLERRTNEYRLRKRFGPAFQERYAAILQRLLSVGLVQRQLDNWLIINNAAVNDVLHLLRNKKYC
ncbi:MAG: ATP-binding protein [Bacteroidota bacterium]